MSKSSAYLIAVFTLSIICFGTWQLFKGNFEAAFTALPFLIIIYFFLLPGARDKSGD